MKKVSEVSALAGVSRRTLQYYDDEGLIIVKRSKDNYRLYDEAALERLWQILVYRALDIELKDIQYLLDLDDDKRNAFLDSQIKKTQERIAELKGTVRLIEQIRQNGMPLAPLENEKDARTFVEHISSLKEERGRRE